MSQRPVVHLLLDSGAYSATTSGQDIDINKFGKFAASQIQHLKKVINLDVINLTSPTAGGEESFQNFMFLKKEYGLETMPVYHANEPLQLLDRMLEITDYIGLSASMAGSVQDAWTWYETIWPYVTDSKGFPLANFHAFGDGTPQCLVNYPWFSADSTTWFIAAGLAGRCFINGKYTQYRTRMAKDINTIESSDSGLKREVWEAAFRKNGLDPDYCMNTKMRESDIMLTRVFLNACYFLELQEATRTCDRFKGSESLLLPKGIKREGVRKTEPVNLHFVITSSTATRALAVLSQLKVKHILLSFFYTDARQWDEMIVPWLYDPLGTCRKHPGLKKQCEILGKMLLNPIIA